MIVEVLAVAIWAGEEHKPQEGKAMDSQVSYYG